MFNLFFSPYITGAGFEQNFTFGSYSGFLAWVLESEMNLNFFDHENLAILLKAQPFLCTELGPARIYIVGSLYCALTYMNAVDEDTEWKSMPTNKYVLESRKRLHRRP